MIYLKVLMILSIVNLSFAQTRTGSGGVLENPPLNVDSPGHEASTTGIKTGSAEEKLLYLAKSMQRQDETCRSKGNRFLDLNQSDFMQTYLKLSILKSTFIADERCQSLESYLKCLNSTEVQENIQRVTEDEEVNQYLQKKYNIRPKEAREVIKFFKKLEQACGSHGCKL